MDNREIVSKIFGDWCNACSCNCDHRNNLESLHNSDGHSHRCETNYQLICLSNDSEEQKRQRRQKVLAFVARDIGAILATIQAIIVGLSFLIAIFDSTMPLPLVWECTITSQRQ